MATQIKNNHIDKTVPLMWRVWTSANNAIPMSAIKGVVRVHDNHEEGNFLVYLDPRFNMDEIEAEIMALS